MFDKVNMTITCTTETRVSAYPQARPASPQPKTPKRTLGPSQPSARWEGLNSKTPTASVLEAVSSLVFGLKG